MTSRRGGSNGAGVPMPRQANSNAHSMAIVAPSAVTIHPQRRGLVNAPEPAIHRGRNHVQIDTNRGPTMSVRTTAKRRASMESTCYLQSAMSTVAELPIANTDPINARILAVSEDRIQGFVRDPIGVITEQSGVDAETVIERVRAMMRAGTIRRVRQTLMATNLAEGALVAWQYPEGKLEAAFDYMVKDDPFSGHVVIRSTDAATPGSKYRLWTTVKVPQGYSIEKHCSMIGGLTGAEHFRVMPANRIFALGVGHVRRKGMEPGSKSDALAEVKDTTKAVLSGLDWRVLTALKREVEPDEFIRDLWRARAAEAGVPLETFYEVAESLNRRKVIGRFSTFLEHVKPLQTGERVTRFNALFHWAVPQGRDRVPQRQHHGRGARHGEGCCARPQGGHRCPSRRDRHPGVVHERLLGRTQRDQAIRDLAVCLRRLLPKPGCGSGDDEGVNSAGVGSRGSGVGDEASLFPILDSRQ